MSFGEKRREGKRSGRGRGALEEKFSSFFLKTRTPRPGGMRLFEDSGRKWGQGAQRNTTKRSSSRRGPLPRALLPWRGVGVTGFIDAAGSLAPCFGVQVQVASMGSKHSIII